MTLAALVAFVPTPGVKERVIGSPALIGPLRDQFLEMVQISANGSLTVPTSQTSPPVPEEGAAGEGADEATEESETLAPLGETDSEI